MRRPLLLAGLFLVVMPLIEIAALVAVGRVIGPWPTVLLRVLMTGLGAWIVRRQGGRAWGALVEGLQTGRMPSRELSDAVLVLVGGVLLLAPGFVTDLVGFFFVLPVTRPLARRLLERMVARRLLGGIVVPGGVATGFGADPGRTWAGPEEPNGSPGAGTTVRGDVLD
jgi:UPF0716 protein FxsA